MDDDESRKDCGGLSGVRDQAKPKSWAGAIAVIAVWIVLAVFAGALVYRLVGV